MELMEKFERMKERYQALKQQNASLKDALKEKQQHIDRLHAKLRESDLEHRRALHESDTLQLQQHKLTKQMEEMTTQLKDVKSKNSNSSAFGLSAGGLLVGANVQKLQEELGVLKEELEMKIKENEGLHMQQFEQRRLHCEENENLQKQIQLHLERIKEKEEALATQESSLHDLQQAHAGTIRQNLSLQQSISEAETQYQAACQEADRVEQQQSSHLASLQLRLSKAVVFDDMLVPFCSCYNIHARDTQLRHRQHAQVVHRLTACIITITQRYRDMNHSWIEAFRHHQRTVLPDMEERYDSSRLPTATDTSSKLRSSASPLAVHRRFASMGSKAIQCLEALCSCTDTLSRMLSEGPDRDSESTLPSSQLRPLLLDFHKHMKRLIIYQTCCLALEEAYTPGTRDSACCPSMAIDSPDRRPIRLLCRYLRRFQRQISSLIFLYLFLFEIPCDLSPSLSTRHSAEMSSHWKQTIRSSSDFAANLASPSELGQLHVNQQALFSFLIRQIQVGLKNLTGHLELIGRSIASRMCSTIPVADGNCPLSGSSKPMVQWVEDFHSFKESICSSSLDQSIDEYFRAQFCCPEFIMASRLFTGAWQAAYKTTMRTAAKQLREAAPRLPYSQAIEKAKQLQSVVRRDQLNQQLLAQYASEKTQLSRERDELREELAASEAAYAVARNNLLSINKMQGDGSTETPSTFGSTVSEDVTDTVAVHDHQEGATSYTGDKVRDGGVPWPTNGYGTEEVNLSRLSVGQEELQQWYRQQVSQMQIQVRAGECAMSELLQELTASLNYLRLGEHERRGLQRQLENAVQSLSDAKDEQALTHKNYDGQISLLSDHICDLSGQLTEKDSKLATIQAHRVLCGRCGVWNTMGGLMADSSSGSCTMCRGHVLEFPS